MAQTVENIEKLFGYGNGITVLRFREKDAVSYLTQGVVPEGYLRSNNRSGAQGAVCFTAIPEAESARDKLGIMIKQNMNVYLSDLADPINPVTVNPHVARVAVITSFEALRGCRNVAQVSRYGFFDERFFPRDILGLNGFNAINFSSGTGGFPAEVRAYFTPPSADRSGITQGIWEGIMVNRDWYDLLKTWIVNAQSKGANVRELPIYDEKLHLLGTTI